MFTEVMTPLKGSKRAEMILPQQGPWIEILEQCDHCSGSGHEPSSPTESVCIVCEGEKTTKKRVTLSKLDSLLRANRF
jgi:DnaJ-class molecular chaperone